MSKSFEQTKRRCVMLVESLNLYPSVIKVGMNVWWKLGDGCNVYCLVYNENQRPVGEISFHCYDENEKSASFNIKIQARYRGKGYAKATMDLMLDYYFNEVGGEVMIDEVINERGIRVLMSYGFEKVDKTEVGILLRLTKDKFNQIQKSD